jgi:hypothetical protein
MNALRTDFLTVTTLLINDSFSLEAPGSSRGGKFVSGIRVFAHLGKTCRYLTGKIPHILPSNYSATLSPR